MFHPVRAALVATALFALAPSATAAPQPQVVDDASDANFINGQGYTSNVPPQKTNPGSQRYADVQTVLWETTFTTKKVKKKKVKVADGFRVTTVLSDNPVPPAGTSLVYRMLGTPPCTGGTFLGVVYYTSAGTDPAIPRSALRDNCTGETRLTAVAEPVIKDGTMVWTVKFTQFPKDLKTNWTLTNLRFEVREIQNLPACVPDNDVTGPTCGTAFGLVDEGRGTTPYTMGK